MFFPFVLEAEEVEYKPKSTHTEFIPIPVYATQPNEGSTWGFMPVFLVVRDDDKSVESIFAPGATFNETIRYTGTFRWYHYPAPTRDLTVIASASTNVNWNARIGWNDLRNEMGAWTDEIDARVRRSIFHRFFGIGPDTPASSETSHTRTRGNISYRRGRNVSENSNIGFKLDAAHDLVESIGVPDLPLSTHVFPTTPGMQGSSITSEAIDLRYDTRDNREYSIRGFYANAQFGMAQGLWNSPSFTFTQFESRALIPQTEWMQAGVRLFWRQVSRSDVPFYHQSSLGGSMYLRGFTEDRFIDQGAWTAELEQRFRVIHSNIFNVAVDWKVDPFISVGQVFPDSGRAFERVRVAWGLGFRAWIHPNVTGRVDIAFGGEGLKAYVDLGYPF